MLQLLVFLLILLWLTGNVSFPILYPLRIVLFYINSKQITLGNIIALLILVWILGFLPSPLRQIAMVFIVLWVLSLLGIFVIAGMSGLILTLLIVGILLHLLGVL